MGSCIKCGKEADLSSTGVCQDCERKAVLGAVTESVPEPMTIAEIVAAFENATGVDEVFALLKETDAPADPIDQQLVRFKLAQILKRFKIPVTSVDAWLKVKATERAVSQIEFPVVETWPEPVDGAELVADLEAYFSRFAHATAESILAASLWTMWTHCFDLFDVAPLLVLTSPTKRCGKTTMLKLIGAVAARRLFSSNLTGPVLFRVVEKYRPTLLVDEADNFARFNDDLKGLLNAGHERDTAQATRTVGDDHDVKTFSTWAPKAFTCIGSLPDTVEDRSVRIVMLRKPADVKKDRARRRPVRAAGDPLASRCVRWAEDNALALRTMPEPGLEALHDRAADNWAGLVMIAELCGVRERAEAAAVVLVSTEEAGVGELLLAHVREAFGDRDRISTIELLELLVNRDDGPWAKWWAADVRDPDRVKKVSADLARRLRKFDPDLKANRRMVGGEETRGYDRDQFKDVWNRWLPAAEEVLTVTSPGAGNLGDHGDLGEEAPETLPLTSGNAAVDKVPKVTKVPGPRGKDNPVAPEGNGFAPGDIARRQGGLKSIQFRVKRQVGDNVDCYELAYGMAGALRTFKATELILVSKAEGEED